MTTPAQQRGVIEQEARCCLCPPLSLRTVLAPLRALRAEHSKHAARTICFPDRRTEVIVSATLKHRSKEQEHVGGADEERDTREKPAKRLALKKPAGTPQKAAAARGIDGIDGMPKGMHASAAWSLFGLCLLLWVLARVCARWCLASGCLVMSGVARLQSLCTQGGRRGCALCVGMCSLCASVSANVTLSAVGE